MDIRKLIPGDSAPEGSDVIRISTLGELTFELTASFSGVDFQIGTYDTFEAAQRAGIHRAVGSAKFPLFIESKNA